MFTKRCKLFSISILTVMSLITSSAWSKDVVNASIQLPATETTENIEEVTLHVFDAEDALFPIVSYVFLTSELTGIPTRVDDNISLRAELEKTKEMATADTLWIEPEVNGEAIGDRQVLLVVAPNISVYGSIKSQSGGFIFPDSSTQTTAFTGELDPTVISSVKDGVTWDELSGIPLGFSDNIDNVGITTEVDPQVNDSQTLNRIPRWNGSSLVSGAVVDNGSNIGIGTSAPDPDHKLHVNGLSRFDLPGGGKIHISTPLTWPGLIVLSKDGTRSDVVFNNDGIYLAKSISTLAPSATNGIMIHDSGRIGIGATNPSARLEVRGEVRTTTSIGATRLWGQGRPGVARYGTLGIESALCSNGSVNFGLSNVVVTWDSAAAGCPAGTWVCSGGDRGISACDTARVDTAITIPLPPSNTWDSFDCDGTPRDSAPDAHLGWISDLGTFGRFGWGTSEQGGSGGEYANCMLLPVWCCSGPN